MAKKNNRRSARERVAKRLKKGKNLNAAKIAKKSGVSEKRAQKIIANKYFKKNDPGKKVSKREAKAAIKSGVSAKAVQKYVKRDNSTNKSGSKAQAFLQKKIAQTKPKTTTPATPPTPKAPVTQQPTPTAPAPSNPPSTSPGQSPGNGSSNGGSNSSATGGQRGGNSSGEVRSGAETTMGGDISGGKTGAVTGDGNTISADTKTTQKFSSTTNANQDFNVKGKGIANSGTMGNIDQSRGDNRNNTISNNWDNSYRNTQNNVGNTYQNDYRVSISGGKSESGSGGGSGMSNMANAVGYSALNNNQAARSQSTLNGLNSAVNASFNAEMMTGAGDRITDINNNVNTTPDYWNAKATQQQNFAMGDLASINPTPYKQAVTKQPKQPDFKKMMEGYMSKLN